MAIFNYRATSGFVIDGPGQTYVLNADTYPTVRDGLTFGYDGGLNSSLDTDAGLGPRLAGVSYVNNAFGGGGVGSLFRYDLPSAGTYNISFALGGRGLTETQNYIQIRDNTTPLLTIGPVATADNHFVDATGTDYTGANWLTSNTPVPLTFSSSILRWIIGTPTLGTDFSILATLGVAPAGGTVWFATLV